MKGAALALTGSTAQEQHEAWLIEKDRTGWKYGAVKDPVLKTHPCMVPYDELPEAQRKKDHLNLATIRAIAAVLGIDYLTPDEAVTFDADGRPSIEPRDGAPIGHGG